jgi:hypothetical protein
MHISPKRKEIGRRARPRAVDWSWAGKPSIERPARFISSADASARRGDSATVKKCPSPKQEGRDASRRPAPFSVLAVRFEIPIILFYFPSVTCDGSRLFERFVLPQTLRRPAPNILAAASFWRAIASPNFWPCHEARRPCHAYFFWLGSFWSIVQRRMQKCCSPAVTL